jgi:phage gpG-like protein
MGGQVDVKRRVLTMKEAFALQPAEMKVMGRRADNLFRVNMKQQFKSEGDSGGEKFQRLSEPYRRWKKRHYPGRKILSLTGKLRKSLTQTKSTNPQHVLFQTTQPRPTITMGTRNRLAAYHGPGRFHNPNLPMRDALQHTETQERAYLAQIADYWFDKKLPRVARTLNRSAWVRVQ